MDPLGETDARELRIFLESVLCDLCRFLHAARDGVAPAETQIHQKVRLGPGAFADIRVAAGRRTPLFHRDGHRLLPPARDREHAAQVRAENAGQRGRGQSHRGRGPGPRLRLPVPRGRATRASRPRPRSRAVGRSAPCPPHPATPSASTSLTSWRHQLLELRQAVDQAKAVHAFGPATAVDPLRSTLLWHFAYWRLAQLREAGASIRGPSCPRGAMRRWWWSWPMSAPTRATCATRATIASSASRSRASRRRRATASSTTGHAVPVRRGLGGGVLRNSGRDGNDASRALECARSLVDIGAAVAEEWQRQIDQARARGGGARGHGGRRGSDAFPPAIQPHPHGRGGPSHESRGPPHLGGQVPARSWSAISSTRHYPTLSGSPSPSSSRSRPRISDA